MKNVRSFIIFLIFSQNIFSQKTKIEKFNSLFQEIEFEELHIYSFDRHPGNFNSTSLYPFKGIQIDTSYYPLFKSVLKSIDSDIYNSKYYANFTFYISGNLQAFIIREFNDGGLEHHIHYLVFDIEKKQFTNDLKLSYSYSYEGSFGGMESWILDFNKDGKKDVLSQNWSDSFTGKNAIIKSENNVILSIWSKNNLISFTINDSLLIKKIEQDFPYYKRNKLSYSTEKLLLQSIQNQRIIKNYNETSNRWSIVVGSDKNMESAKYEIKRAEKIIGFNYKYNLDFRKFEIYKKHNRFYTVIEKFQTKTEAEIALREIQKIFNKSAYIIDLNKWCKNFEKNGSKKCIDKNEYNK
ncbi:hypothetical protein [Aureivirga sp. CE67]|uniref:hypothetical protein n=1 Tax=Aureivirga sp. CE67 TaxID=1788983 RepID=UPI0018CA83A1|nr:hypothetical protein [Aureivirga sp. CE67]